MADISRFKIRHGAANEALSAVVYRPENLQQIDRHHRQLVDKTCVLSASDDQLKTIKTFLVNAALKQGISKHTCKRYKLLLRSEILMLLLRHLVKLNQAIAPPIYYLPSLL